MLCAHREQCAIINSELKPCSCGCGRLTKYTRCKVCEYKHTHKDFYIPEGWTEKEIDIILDNVLYEKIEYINELVDILGNKKLFDIAYLLCYQVHIGNKKQKIKLFCTNCGNEYHVTASRYVYNKKVTDNNFCSRKCCAEYVKKTEMCKGEKSPLWKHVKTKCAYCGKEIDVKLSDLKRTNRFGENNLFCNKKCSNSFMSMYYIGDKNGAMQYYKNPDNAEKISIRMRENALKALKNGNSFTKPHKIINKILDNNGIKYENEFIEGYYSMDIALVESGLFIEIEGDYWHSNPTIYKIDKERNNTQKSITIRDKRKHTYITSYKNKKILYVWETDINNREYFCEALIKLYIDNNGQLENYNSFNYNDDLSLKEEIISPYFYK